MNLSSELMGRISWGIFIGFELVIGLIAGVILIEFGV